MGKTIGLNLETGNVEEFSMDDVASVCLEGRNTILSIKNRNKYNTDLTFQQKSDYLVNESGFLKVDRGVVVNIQSIESLDKNKHTLRLINGEQFYVAGSQINKIEQILNKKNKREK